MLPFSLILVSVGLLTAENDPRHPRTSTTRQLSPQSVYSAHNYKQPQSTGSSHWGDHTKITVGKITALPPNYKQQRTAEQPAGSLSINYVPVIEAQGQNYKSQQSMKSAKSTTNG